MSQSELARPQLMTMLRLQNEMNLKVNPQWLADKSPFLRAVVVEGAEAIEHHGWKWWKKQDLDLAQLQMEVVDIWHFMLSQCILDKAGDKQQAADWILTESQNQQLEFDGKNYELARLNCLDSLELMIGLASAKRMDIGLFSRLLENCQMTWEVLFEQYVGKNVLNFFRQDHGYQLGTYSKHWHGKEDNEHLVELMEGLDPFHPDYQQALYFALKQRYEVAG